MNQDLVDEVNYLIEILTKSGFFSVSEITEILDEQFIDEEIDFSEFDISLSNSNNINFNKLEKVFKALSIQDIVAIHNCGYDIEEGVADAFELYVHLRNNKFSPKGFCFYTFEDVEESIEENTLKITFGDFENDEKKALEIGKIVADALEFEDLPVVWDGTVYNQIELNPFQWDKLFDGKKEYEIEGAYNMFINDKQVLK